MSGLRGLMGSANKSSSSSRRNLTGAEAAPVTSPCSAALRDIGAARVLEFMASWDETAMSAPSGWKGRDWLIGLVKVFAVEWLALSIQVKE